MVAVFVFNKKVGTHIMVNFFKQVSYYTYIILLFNKSSGNAP